MFFLILIGTFLIGSDLLSENQMQYSFEELQKEAVAYSEKIGIAQIETAIAREKIEEIRGLQLPKLSLEGSANFRNNEMGFIRKNPAYEQYHNQSHSHDKPAANAPCPIRPPKYLKTIATQRQQASGKLSLIVPICDFGYMRNLLLAQDSIVEASGHEKEKVIQDVLYATAHSYYKALEGSKILSVINESIKLLTQQLFTAKDLYEAGLITENDVLVVEVQLASRKQEQIQAQHNIQSALAILSRLTGKEILSVENLKDVSQKVVFNTTLDEAVIQSDKHPTLKKLASSIQAASFDYEATKTENYPNISSFWNYNVSSDKYLWHRSWMNTGIAIEIPIISGGITTSKLAQKLEHISCLDKQYTEALRNIHLATEQSYLKADSAFLRIPVAEKSITLAEDNLAISQDLFEEGLIMSDDVLSDEERLAQARSNYYQALYSFYIAQADLDYTSGRIHIGNA